MFVQLDYYCILAAVVILHSLRAQGSESETEVTNNCVRRISSRSQRMLKPGLFECQAKRSNQSATLLICFITLGLHNMIL